MENSTQAAEFAQQQIPDATLLTNQIVLTSDAGDAGDAGNGAADVTLILATSSDSQSNQMPPMSQHIDDDKSKDGALPVPDQLATHPSPAPNAQDSSSNQHLSTTPLVESTLPDVQSPKEGKENESEREQAMSLDPSSNTSATTDQADRTHGRDSSDTDVSQPATKRVRINSPSTPDTLKVARMQRPSPKLSSDLDDARSDNTLVPSASTPALSSDDAKPVVKTTTSKDNLGTSSSLVRTPSDKLSRPFRLPTKASASTAPTTDSDSGNTSVAPRPDRAKGFKIVRSVGVTPSSSSSGLRRVASNPTTVQINQLNARIRTLRLALRYSREDKQRPLYPLTTKWRAAGQDAANELFSLTPAPATNAFPAQRSNWGWDGSDFDVAQLEPTQPTTEQEEESPWNVGRMMDLIGLPKELLGWKGELDDFA